MTGGKYREVFIELRTVTRSNKMTWDVMKTKLLLAEKDEEAEGGSDESDNSDDNADKALQTSSMSTSALLEEVKRLRSEVALFTGQGAGGAGNENKRKCFYCKKPGHIKAECRKRQRDMQQNGQQNGQQNFGRPKFPSQGRGTNLWDQAFCSVELKFPSPDQCLYTGQGHRDNSWLIIVDGAATTHVVNNQADREAMLNQRKVEEVILMNKFPCKIHARGDLVVHYEGVPIMLRDVAYVPSSQHRLLSVSKLLDEHKEGAIVYTQQRVEVQLSADKIIKGHRKGGLYYLDGQATIGGSDTALSTQDDELDLADFEQASSQRQSTKSKFDYSCLTHNYYNALDVLESGMVTDNNKEETKSYMTDLHRRLGHVGLRACKDVVKRHGTALNVTKTANKRLQALDPQDVSCEPCSLAKSRRKHPAGLQRRRTARTTTTCTGTESVDPVKANQMTADTAGPNDRSRCGKRYSHVVVLDPHAYSEIGFGASKRQASEHIQENLRMWNDAFLKDVPITLKTDRGGEYTSINFEKWLKKKGIRHKLTAPNSSAGSAEKKIDTIQNLSKAMRNDAGAPRRLWVESHKYANDVTLMVPSASKKLKGLSPWESRWKETPPLHKLHRWGCVAYVNVPKARRTRQQNKGRKGMFVGLCKDRNDGYRFYDADLNTIFTGRSATFHDNLMYYKEREREQSKPKRVNSHVRFENEEGKADDNTFLPSISLPLPTPAIEERRELPKRKRTQAEFYDPRLFDLAYKHDREQEQRTEEALATFNSNSKPPAKIATALHNWIRKNARFTADEQRLKSGHIPDGPDAFQEAVTAVDRSHWVGAIVRELRSFDMKKVMQAIKREDIPHGRKTIKARWVFDIKRNADGTVEKYKARLVAKGFLQRYGQDYLETFAPTPSFTSIRYLANMALQRGWRVSHMDVVTAFLEGVLEEWERIYLEPPPGFDLPPDQVFELHKCIYGLKQSARKFNKKMDKLLKNMGLQQSTADKCVYLSYGSDGQVNAAVAMHVDDVLITGEPAWVLKIKAMLNKAFTMKDLGQLSWYLGVHFAWTAKAVYLSQGAYTKDVLERHRMEDSNTRTTPAESTKLVKPSSPISLEEKAWLDARDKTETTYRQAVGALRYLADRTRPDIAYAVGQLALHMQDPRRDHWIAVKHVLAYLRGTANFALRYQKITSGKQHVIGWSDSDWAQNKDDRSSTSGYVFTTAGGAISWASSKQRVIARSSAEAELVALDQCAREGLWLRKLEHDLKTAQGPTVLREDNEAAIAISEKNQRTKRTKHIDVKYFAISDNIEKGSFLIRPVNSADNLSDTFTKGLGRSKFQQFREAMGVIDLPVEGER
jgi:transposase InsO family protein